MKAAESVLHLRREQPRRMKHMIPDHGWALVKRYGLAPTDAERKAACAQDSNSSSL